MWLSKDKKGRKKEKREESNNPGKRKIVRWAIDNKENWEREEEIEEDHRKIKEMVPKKFLK